MARKGVLISDPSVSEMSYDMWMFEALALRKKEEQWLETMGKVTTEVFQSGFKAFRENVIYLLGLNIGAGQRKEDSDMTPFLPLNMYLGDPGVMKEMLEREKNEEATTKASSDTELDSLNERLMKLEAGDLEPIFTGIHSSDPMERWHSPEYQAMLRDAGIEVVERKKEDDKD